MYGIFRCAFIRVNQGLQLSFTGGNVANIKSAKKRIRTNEKSKTRNRQVKSTVRTSTKKIILALDPKDGEHAKLNEIHQSFIKNIDTAASKGVISRNAASRKKSRIAKKVNATAAQPQA